MSRIINVAEYDQSEAEYEQNDRTAVNVQIDVQLCQERARLEHSAGTYVILSASEGSKKNTKSALCSSFQLTVNKDWG